MNSFTFPPRAIKGFELFNLHRFFEAHEELEIAWRAEKSWIKEMYRGVLQVGVAYYHIQNMNYSGAKKMFERSFKWLEPYPDNCYGVDIRKLKLDSKAAYGELLTLGPDYIDQFDQSFFKPLNYVVKI
jgi:hypothetical protein